MAKMVIRMEVVDLRRVAALPTTTATPVDVATRTSSVMTVVAPATVAAWADPLLAVTGATGAVDAGEEGWSVGEEIDDVDGFDDDGGNDCRQDSSGPLATKNWAECRYVALKDGSEDVPSIQ